MVKNVTADNGWISFGKLTRFIVYPMQMSSTSHFGLSDVQTADVRDANVRDLFRSQDPGRGNNAILSSVLRYLSSLDGKGSGSCKLLALLFRLRRWKASHWSSPESWSSRIWPRVGHTLSPFHVHRPHFGLLAFTRAEGWTG